MTRCQKRQAGLSREDSTGIKWRTRKTFQEYEIDWKLDTVNCVKPEVFDFV